MPVRKKAGTGASRKKKSAVLPLVDEKCGCRGVHCALLKKIFATLFGILLVYIIVLLGTMIRNNLQEYYYIGQSDRAEKTIVVEGQGKVTAKPDIAITTMGMVSEGDTVLEAQKANTLVMNKLMVSLKELGIEEEDLQTSSYNIYPRYNYSEEDGRELSGYEVRQSVKVKIRNLEKANQILALAGKVGVNSVSGLDFTIDDKDVYKAEARAKALEKAAEKALALSNALGVKVVGIVSYDEYESNVGGPIYKAYSEALGMGGEVAPQLESGSTEILLNVSITLEIR